MNRVYKNSRSVAILLAAYNAQDFISAQIDSILRQTSRDWTLYVRDDGSTDATAQIIENYCRIYSDKIIQIDERGENTGCRASFFRLLETVESDYYMFCDADDEWLPEKVEVLYRAMQGFEREYPDIPLQIFADLMICDSRMNVIEPSHWQAAGIRPELFLSYNYMAVSCNAGGACSIYNHRVKELIFPLTNDFLIYDFWIAINVAKYGKFKVIHRPLVKYRQHDNQIYGVNYGERNTLRYKFKHIGALVKQYRWEARHHAAFGYGPPVKYYWYKLLTVLKIRFGKYM